MLLKWQWTKDEHKVVYTMLRKDVSESVEWSDKVVSALARVPIQTMQPIQERRQEGGGVQDIKSKKPKIYGRKRITFNSNDRTEDLLHDSFCARQITVENQSMILIA